jgi:hypothetical protein
MTRTAHRALRRIRLDDVLPQVLREVSPPLTERGPSDIEAIALLTDGFHHDVHVRVRLVRMQSHRVSMLQPELLHDELVHGFVQPVRW